MTWVRLSVALAVALPVCCAATVARGADAPPAPGAFVVALGLGDPMLQAGAVRGRDVIVARGFEVELARILARRLGGRVVRFVYVPSTARLLASGTSGWHLAFAGIERSTAPRRAELTTSYLTTDVAVVTRRGLAAPRRLAELRRAVLCAVRGGDGARVASAVVRPTRAPLLVAGAERLRTVLRTGACDAALVPAVEVGRFVDGQRRLFGAVAGRIRHGDGLAAVVATGSGLPLESVNRELARLHRDGTLSRIARAWLGIDPAALRVLR
jgi:ABC-type amino acid transport substrate-binding protein